MKTNAFVIAAVCFSGTLATRAQAQSEAPQENRAIETSLDLEVLLNTPVVTAGGIEQSRAKAPANIVSWERDEMRRHGWTSLAEVFANTPGLYVNDDLVLPSVGVRGVGPGLRGGSRIMRIMINGIEVTYRPDLTAFLGMEFIPFDTIERIEIAKGPLSALYGANAFLATVNIITRVPTNGLEGEVQGNTRLVRGNSGFGFGGTVGWGGEEVSALVSYSQATVDRSGLTLGPSYNGALAGGTAFEGFYKNPTDNDKARPQSVYGSFDFHNEWFGDLKIQGGRQMLDSNAEFQPGAVRTGSRIALNNTYGSIDYAKNLGSVVIAANASLSGGGPAGDERLFAQGEPEFRYQRNFSYTAFTVGGSARFELPLQLSLKAGVDYLRDSEDILYFSRTEIATGTRAELVGDDPDTTRTLTNFGAYAQLSGTPIAVLPKLFVLAGGRVDAPTYFDAQFSWRGAVSYEFSPRFTGKLFVGRSFQTPSAVQLFGRPGFGIVYNTVGNRTFSNIGLDQIQPQKVFSTELNGSYAATDTLVFDMSLFYQRVTDKIEFLPVTASATANYTALNLSDQEFFGGELGMRALGQRIGGYATASAQMITNRDQDGSMTFRLQPPREFPTATVYAGLTTRIPEIFVAVDVVGRLVGPRGSTRSNSILNDFRTYSLPAYAAFDVTLTSLNLFFFGEGYETRVLVSARNLFNNGFKYTGDGGFDIPNVGRMFYLQLAQTF